MFCCPPKIPANGSITFTSVSWERVKATMKSADTGLIRRWLEPEIHGARFLVAPENVPKVTEIAGTIAAGKSTAIEGVETADDPKQFQYLLEPVGVWKPLLNSFGEDPKTWALALEQWVYASFIGLLPTVLTLCPHKPVVVERGTFSYLTFLCLMVKRKILTRSSLRTLLSDRAFLLPNHIIYIKLPLDVAMARLKKRNRAEEMNHEDRSYFTECLVFHDEAFQPATTINGNQDPVRTSMDLKNALCRLHSQGQAIEGETSI